MINNSFDVFIKHFWIFWFVMFCLVCIIQFIQFLYGSYKQYKLHKDIEHIHAYYKSKQDYLDYQLIRLESLAWTEFKPNTDLTIDEMLEIIEDALSYGFEFKISDHKIWWRDL